MKGILIICLLSACSYSLIAQNSIEGRITDQDNKPLPGATVYMTDLNKGTISNENGYYRLLHIPKGKSIVQYSYVGYGNRIETVEMKGDAVVLNIRLRQTAIASEEVVVSGFYSNTQHDNAVKIEVLKLDPLMVKTTPNFTELITRVPGVDMISKGSGVAKPVIRGLSMNDILVLNNGVRFENYQLERDLNLQVLYQNHPQLQFHSC